MNDPLICKCGRHQPCRHCDQDQPPPSLPPTDCSASRVDYGDFTEFQVRTMVADYCRDITLGFCGWGVPFTAWVELKGVAKHDKMHRLISKQNASVEAAPE